MQFVFEYFVWHYTQGLRDITVLWSNIVWFLSNFFSLPLLATTLFSPWKRLREERKSGFDIEDFLSVLVVNILMRIVGFLFRITVIAIGLVVLTLTFGLFLIHLLIWVFFPLVIIGLIYYGSSILFIKTV